MILVDEGYLNNHTVARIGEEVGILRKPEETLREYAMRVIAELTFVYPEGVRIPGVLKN